MTQPRSENIPANRLEVSLITMLGGLGFVSASALLLNIILARVLTVEDIGHIRLVRAVLEFLLIPAGFGMSACVAKHVADSRATPEERERAFATGLGLALAVATVLTIAAFALMQIPNVLRDETALRLLRWMIFILPFTALFGALQGYYQGTGRIRELATVQAGRSLVLLVAGAGLAAGFGLAGWGAGRALAEIAPIFIGLFLLHRLPLRKFQRQLVSGFASFGGYAATTQALTALLVTADVVLLDRFKAGPEAIGLYGIAILLFSAIQLLPQAFGQSSFSLVAATAHDPQKTWHVALRYTALVLALALPAAIVAFICAPLIVFIFGAEYRESIWMFRALLPAFLLVSAGSVAVNLVVGAGLMRANLIGAAATAALNLALLVALIPLWGVAGAIVSITLAHALRSAISFAILHRYRQSARAPAEATAAARRRHLLIIPAWYPNREQAMSGQFNRRDARLLASRYDVSVIYVHFIDRGAKEAWSIDDDEGVRTIVYYCPRRYGSPALFPLLYLGAFMKAYRKLRATAPEPELVYLRNLLPCGIAGLALRWLYGIPYITVDMHSGLPEHLRSLPKRWIAAMTLRFAARNSAVSKFQRDAIRQFAPRAEIDIVFNIVPKYEMIRADPGDIARLARAAYVGNVVPVKGWDVLLDALALFVKEKGKPIHLTIAGGGELDRLRARIAELHLSDHVTVLGPRPHDEALRLIAEHHFLVLPSRIDTCPNVVFESLAMGRPVLATRCGGPEEMLDASEGVLVEKESPAALCEGLDAMIENYSQFDPMGMREGVFKKAGFEVLAKFVEEGFERGKQKGGY